MEPKREGGLMLPHQFWQNAAFYQHFMSNYQ